LEAKTGKEIWRERVPGKYSASPLAGAGRIYFLSQEGRTTVIADAPKFEVLAENDLDGMLMASPAAVNGDLILRSDTHLYRIGSGR
jgi:outer membrane protein assembly factor BamB